MGFLASALPLGIMHILALLTTTSVYTDPFYSGSCQCIMPTGRHGSTWKE